MPGEDEVADALAGMTLDGDAEAKKKKNKKKKKKKNVLATDPLSKRVNETKDAPFCIYSDPTVGRKLVSTKALPAGLTLLSERALPVVISERYKGLICANCFKTCDRKEGEAPPAQCDVCKSKDDKPCAVYCSEACKEADKEKHAKVCPVYKITHVISEQEKIGPDLLRAACAYIVAKEAVMSKEEDEPPKEVNFADHVSHWEDLKCTVSNEEKMHIDARNAMLKGSERVLKAMPAAQGVCEKRELQEVMMKFNSNCHLLYQNEGMPTFVSFGVGLFPLASLMNHSCFPNCVFFNTNDTLSVRTIRPVQRAEQLTVNYGDLYTSLENRQAYLRRTKLFHCHCNRCALAPISILERDAFSHEKFLGGVLCDAGGGTKGCSGLLRYRFLEKTLEIGRSNVPKVEPPPGVGFKLPKLPMHPFAKAAAGAAAARNGTAAPAADGDGGGEGEDEGPPPLEGEEDNGPPPLEGEEGAEGAGGEEEKKEPPKIKIHPQFEMVCEECGAVGDHKKIVETNMKCNRIAEEVLKEMAMGKLPAKELAHRAAKGLKDVEALVSPKHEVVFKLLVPSVNCCPPTDAQKKSGLIRQTIDMAEKCLPPNFPPMGEYRQALADSLALLIEQTDNKAVKKRVAAERVECLETLLSETAVCRGEGHNRYTATKTALEEARRTLKALG